MDQEKKSGYRTLLVSVLMSSYGPVILGLGLRVGHSSTQISDFTRRTAELLALIAALVVYTITNKRGDIHRCCRTGSNRKIDLYKKLYEFSNYSANQR